MQRLYSREATSKLGTMKRQREAVLHIIRNPSQCFLFIFLKQNSVNIMVQLGRNNMSIDTNHLRIQRTISPGKKENVLPSDNSLASVFKSSLFYWVSSAALGEKRWRQKRSECSGEVRSCTIVPLLW